jgi:FHA domain-containing protein
VITLSVTTFNNQPAHGALSASFDELGGTIGRADTNHLVLPDPDRTVSRVAAQVVYRNGAYAIVDRGSNPIVVNGQSLGSGREVMLKAGDRVRIGGYELAVSVAAPAAASIASDPFADLLGPAPAAAPAGSAVFDPLAGAAAPHGAPAAAGRSAPKAAPAAAAGGIPMDWDPFAPDAKAPSNDPLRGAGGDRFGLDVGAAAPAPLVPDLGVPSAEPSSLDQLFGLGPSSGGDPLAKSVLDAPAALPNMAAEADPLRSLDSAPRASAPTMSDQVSDLNRPFVAPPVAMPPAASGAVMSWDREGDVSHTVIRAPRPGAAPPPAPADAVRPPPVPAPAPKAAIVADLPLDDLFAPAPPSASPSLPLPPAPPNTPPPAAVAAAAPTDAQALIDALCRGLQSPQLRPPALTPEVMERLGRLLHEAVGGTVDLLAARAAFKRELRAQATTIVPRNNNPLKFSPSAEVAIQHLLSPPARGFMDAEPAMRDAYNDLRAHQIGFVAGLQAALDGVLARFDPAELEKALTARSVLHSLVPASRKARMWEVFVDHYARIRADATDDFHTLFGQAFLKAYEAQIDKLDQEPPR